MKVYFANSSYISAPEWAVLRGGSRKKLKLHVRYGIFEHPVHGLTLIDTGYGPSVLSAPNRSFALKAYSRLFKAHPDPLGELSNVLQRFDCTTDDVKQIIITHFHADHVSELKAFPNARLYCNLDALASLRSRSSFGNLMQGGFKELLPDPARPSIVDIMQKTRVLLPWDLGDAYDLLGDGTVLAVPLPGHALGHFGVCFPKLSTPLLYGCDAQWVRAAILKDRAPRSPLRLVYHDAEAVNASNLLCRRFAEAGGDLVLCHDHKPGKYDLGAQDE